MHSMICIKPVWDIVIRVDMRLSWINDAYRPPDNAHRTRCHARSMGLVEMTRERVLRQRLGEGSATMYRNFQNGKRMRR